MLEISRWMISLTAFAFFACVAAFHARNMIGYWLTGRSIGSNAPVVGGLAGVIAVVVSPLNIQQWWWLPLIVDLGTGVYVLLVVVVGVKYGVRALIRGKR